MTLIEPATTTLVNGRGPSVQEPVVLSASEWSAQQFAIVNLGDQRRNKRALEIGTKMAAHPEASLPQQMEDHDALRAAYGVLNCPEVTLEALVAPHCAQTLATARRAALVLFVEDTSELDYTAHPQTRGLGPIGDGKGRGLLLHSTLAVLPAARQVLGLAHVQVVLRQPAPSKHSHWTRSPEAQLWEHSAQAVGTPPAGVTWVHVSDRGSDIFEYMAACVDLDKDFVVRAFHDRVLGEETGSPSGSEEVAHTLLDYARHLPPVPTAGYTVHVPAHPVKGKMKPARDARVVLAWASVTLPAPVQAPPPIRSHPPLRVWVLRVWEPDPPPDVAPVEWILLCSIPIETIADAYRTVEWYTCRWLCEDYHQCLKTGCRVEQTQLDDGADICRLLGFAAPIAVRLLQLRQLARPTPDLPATAVVDPVLVEVLARRQRLIAATLTIADFWRVVARLGGHQGRRRDGPPGWQTLWKGWRYLSDMAEGAQLFFPGGSP
jgi:Transposase DNA-binding/Transposase Tn5 dimerisation domain